MTQLPNLVYSIKTGLWQRVNYTAMHLLYKPFAIGFIVRLSSLYFSRYLQQSQPILVCFLAENMSADIFDNMNNV